MVSEISETIIVELVGGPKDGLILRIKKPYNPCLSIRSPLKSDISYLYEFDEEPSNDREPLKFIFRAYQQI